MTTRIEGGFHWPANDKTGAYSILRHAGMHFPRALGFGKGRKLCVQAGGNVGVYPAQLAKYFAEVRTFEPDPANFACLQRNLAGVQNVTAMNVALGDKPGSISLLRNPDNVGAYSIDGEGDMPMITLDSLELPACDLIWFDIEGSELIALKGGEATINRFRPVIILEDMAIGSAEGVARRWCEAKGYRQAAKLLNDYVMVP